MSRPRLLTRWWFNLPLRNKGLLVLALPIVALVLRHHRFVCRSREQQAGDDGAADPRGGDAATPAAAAHRLLDLETGVRGYALTRDRAFLAPFETCAHGAPANTCKRWPGC